MKTKIKSALFSMLTMAAIALWYGIVAIVPLWVSCCIGLLPLFVIGYMFWYSVFADKDKDKEALQTKTRIKSPDIRRPDMED